MKKMISLVLVLCICINFNLFAANLNNSDEYFMNQPCFGLDNINPSGTGSIFYADDFERNKQLNIENERKAKENNEKSSATANMFKCRIYHAIFYTYFNLENFVPCGKGFLIKYHYTHDGNDYFLKYDEDEKLYRPYNAEELSLEIAKLNSN